MSEFEKWFIAQHGKRPSDKSREELYNEYVKARAAAVRAEKNLDECDKWDARKESALYAWNARVKE